MSTPLPNNPFPVVIAADCAEAVVVYVNGQRFLLSNEACRELERDLQRIRLKSEERARRGAC
jgi:hypothetical protein